MIQFKYFKSQSGFNNASLGSDDIAFLEYDNSLKTHDKVFKFADENTGTITKVGNTTSGTVTVSSSNNTANWGSPVTVGSVGGVDLKFTMPSNPGGPDGDTTYSAGTGITITGTNNAINVTYGTTANTACQGNDSRLSDARPASDVSAWAKAETKPSYSWSEISDKPTVLSSVPTDYKKSYASVVSVSANTNNVTCPSTLSSDGEECTVLYVNSGTTADYTVTISTSYTTPDGEQLSLTCPKGGYCEVNYLKIGNTIYARGV